MNITHRGKVITISAQVTPDARVGHTYTPAPGASDIPGSRTDFDTLLAHAHHMLSHYRRSEPGSTWGCDGIGYIAQKKTGHVVVNMSGVGPRKFAQGERERASCSKCIFYDSPIQA